MSQTARQFQGYGSNKYKRVNDYGFIRKLSIDLNNGTYIITASKSNYSDNSITRTVNGATVTGANISLSFFSGILLVAANRFVILDDWRTGAPWVQDFLIRVQIKVLLIPGQY